MRKGWQNLAVCCSGVFCSMAVAQKKMSLRWLRCRLLSQHFILKPLGVRNWFGIG